MSWRANSLLLGWNSGQCDHSGLHSRSQTRCQCKCGSLAVKLKAHRPHISRHLWRQPANSTPYIFIYFTLLIVASWLPRWKILLWSHLIQKQAIDGRSASNPPPAAEWFSPWRGKAPVNNRFPGQSESSLTLVEVYRPAPRVTKGFPV